jgi:general secretion pathway protein G
MKRNRTKKDPAITFIEVIVWVAILLVFLSGTVYLAIGQLSRANRAAALSQIQNIGLALDSYFIDNRRYPSEEQGLKALSQPPILEPVPQNWTGPYVQSQSGEFIDPWGNELVYEVPGPGGLPYAIISYGADGRPGGDGNDEDISNYQ